MCPDQYSIRDSQAPGRWCRVDTSAAGTQLQIGGHTIWTGGFTVTATVPALARRGVHDLAFVAIPYARAEAILLVQGFALAYTQVSLWITRQ